MKTWREMLSKYDTTHLGFDALRELVGEVIIKLAAEERPSGEWVDERESVELLADRDDRIYRLRRALWILKMRRLDFYHGLTDAEIEREYPDGLARAIAEMEREGL